VNIIKLVIRTLTNFLQTNDTSTTKIKLQVISMVLLTFININATCSIYKIPSVVTC